MAGGLVLAGLGYLLFGACDQDFEKWPIPEEFTRDGSGKLADLIPGDWEIICHVAPYEQILTSVRAGLVEAGLPELREEEKRMVFLRYIPENQFAFVLVDEQARSRVLYINKAGRNKFGYEPTGSRCLQRDNAGYEVDSAITPHGMFSTIRIMALTRE